MIRPDRRLNIRHLAVLLRQVLARRAARASTRITRTDAGVAPALTAPARALVKSQQEPEFAAMGPDSVSVTRTDCGVGVDGTLTAPAGGGPECQ